MSDPRPEPAKLGAEKLSPEEQRLRFIEAARAAGASEDEADFDAVSKRIAPSGEAEGRSYSASLAGLRDAVRGS